MSVTAGTISLVSKDATSITVVSTAATAGTGPYTYQYYISTTTGFSPSGGNIVAGATALQSKLSGLIPGTAYFVKIVATDTGASNATATSAQLAVSTLNPTPSQNQFALAAQLGALDMNYNYDTVSVQIDSSQSGALYAGAAVKIVDNGGGVPKVIGCAANTDEVLGFIKYDMKDAAFTAGMPCEISMAGNMQYMYATAAIARGIQVTLDLTTNGGVAPITAMSGNDIVGWAYDKASNPGDLIRVFIRTPSFLKA